MTKHPCLFGQPTGYAHKDPRFIDKVMDILLQITWEASVQFSNSFEILPNPYILKTSSIKREVFSTRKRIAQIEMPFQRTFWMTVSDASMQKKLNVPTYKTAIVKWP